MTGRKIGSRRTRLLAATAILAGLFAFPAAAQPSQPLTPQDQALYAQAFAAAERGDAAAADADLAQVSDNCLTGKVRYLELTHGRSHAASYQELSNWLKDFSDMPGASEVYALALRNKPADAALPAPAATTAGAPDGSFHMAASKESHAAREAFFDGDLTHALSMARAAGDHWIAGMASWRLGQYADAMLSFETLAANPAEDPAVRAAGGVWAARAATAAGFPDRAAPLLKIAAAAPDTFYGMIAERKLELSDDPLGGLIDATLDGKPPVAAPAVLETTLGSHESPLDRLARTDPRAHRALALAQLSRSMDASAELRAGYAAATDDQSRGVWMGLMYQVNGQAPAGEIVLHGAGSRPVSHTAYPVPNLTPAGGFTIDKSLVYAITWQESRFNSLAVSPVGAIGLMQLMPPSAASMAGDSSLTSNPIKLFDTGENLALGQQYIQWLEANSGNYDLLRTIAAYNGGPGTLSRTMAMVGPDADSLTIMESVPFSETRAYVRKVVAAYWTYRRQFGLSSRTLDAAASDQRVDVRLDVASAPVEQPQSPSAPARQALEILLHRAG